MAANSPAQTKAALDGVAQLSARSWPATQPRIWPTWSPRPIQLTGLRQFDHSGQLVQPSGLSPTSCWPSWPSARPPSINLLATTQPTHHPDRPTSSLATGPSSNPMLQQPVGRCPAFLANDSQQSFEHRPAITGRLQPLQRQHRRFWSLRRLRRPHPGRARQPDQPIVQHHPEQPLTASSWGAGHDPPVCATFLPVDRRSARWWS